MSLPITPKIIKLKIAIKALGLTKLMLQQKRQRLYIKAATF